MAKTKDNKLLEKLVNAVKDDSYDGQKAEYKKNLRKYVLSSCLLKLCDKPLPGGKKYCVIKFKEKIVSTQWRDPEERTLYYTNASDLRPGDVGRKEQYWGDRSTSGSVPYIVTHNNLRNEHYYEDRHDSALQFMVKALYEKHYDLLVEAIKKMNKNVDTAKKRSEDGKQRGKLKSAVTFTKPEQVTLAKRLYREFLDKELDQVEKNIKKVFGCKFQFNYTNITCITDSYIIALATEGNVETDLSGKTFFDELNYTELGAEKTLHKWMNDKEPLFRRFALTFMEDQLTLGLLDQDETVRLNAELRTKSK